MTGTSKDTEELIARARSTATEWTDPAHGVGPDSQLLLDLAQALEALQADYDNLLASVGIGRAHGRTVREYEAQQARAEKAEAENDRLGEEIVGLEADLRAALKKPAP